MSKRKFYSLDRISQLDAHYNVIFGLRSNGKTYAVLRNAIKSYLTDGSEFGLIRRWEEDFKGKRGATMFQGLADTGEIEKLSKGKWNTVRYESHRFYLYHTADRKEDEVCDTKPFAYAFALTSSEHDKSTSYTRVRNILFDEFITRDGYIPDEFVVFNNLLSTIIRYRKDVKIYMCANTISKFCPYFEEMGLKNVQKMKPGDLDVYRYGEDGKLRVAVEYCKNENTDEENNNFYFAFDNPKLKMITTGEWELAIYPHCPCDFTERNIVFIYFIKFNNKVFQCEIVRKGMNDFTYIHEKTTPLKKPDEDIIFDTTQRLGRNYRVHIHKPYDNIGKVIWSFFQCDKVFYQDNSTGDVIENYLRAVGAIS